MKDIHDDLKAAKNLLHSNEAWHVLFEIQVSENEVFRLVNNEAAVTFGGNEYSPFPIGFEQLEESTQGDLPYVNVIVSNVDRMVSGYLESHGGLLDKKVVMRFVHESNLSTSTATIESNFVIRETSVSQESVSFRLSVSPFFEVDLPHQLYYRHRCRWQFKEAGTCGWTSGGTGSTEACDKTLDGPNGCSAHLNQSRFGGFPGIPRRRI